ncbi:hypothetical protein ACFVU2_16850 [Leifsonia sp. NPDC058194]|uniref:hypothetical protein n=1 Tax=Leifsonia sp. NPDC058194 TaxID=3346374 RepID=UPI0036D99AE4
MVRSHRLSIIGAAAVLIALSGCSALGLGAPDGPATRTPSPTPTPTAVALDCPTIVAGTDLTALLGAQAAVVTTPPGIVESVAAGGPLALPATGGAACRWRHGDDTLTVEVLPHAAAAWKTLSEANPTVATPGAGYDGGASLGGDCTLVPTVSCRTNVLVADAWLSVVLDTASAPGLTEAGFHDAVQRMLPPVTAAVANAPTPPAEAPLDCAAADLRTELQRAFALPGVMTLPVEPTFHLSDGVLRAPGVTQCDFQPTDDSGSGRGTYLGSLSVLPGTPAVFEQLRTAVLAEDASARSELMTVKGEQVPALVWGGTVEGTPFVSVDAMVGSHWVEFQSSDLDDTRSLAVVQWIAATL